MAETISPNHRHTPATPAFRKCPVCHQRVFSPGGIHPQCAVKRHVDQDNAEIRAQKKAAENASAENP